MTLEQIVCLARLRIEVSPNSVIEPGDVDIRIANAIRAFLGSDAGSFSEMSTQGMADQCRMQARANLDPEYSRFMVAVANRLSSIGGE